MKANTILYVRDQQRATEFYKAVLCLQPTLNVPGMTEFRLSDDHVLGLMPEAGIKRLLGEELPDPAGSNGIPRAELYLTVENPERHHALALENGARELSKYGARNWGDHAAYSLDLDGHVLVFAKVSPAEIWIKSIEESHRELVRTFIKEHWGADFIVVRGRKYYPHTLPGFFVNGGGEIKALLTYSINGHEAEIVSFDSVMPSKGIGTALLNQFIEHARAAGCRRVWLITTNDNLDAFRFYQKRGFSIFDVHRGAVEEARKMKSEIPSVGQHGILIRDEIEMELKI